MKTGLTANELDRTERRNTPIPKRSFIREKTDIEVSALPVSIQGNQYLVDFGQGSSPRFHKVSKNKECSCGAQYCEAIEAVYQYLQAGGLRAPIPRERLPVQSAGARLTGTGTGTVNTPAPWAGAAKKVACATSWKLRLKGSSSSSPITPG